jgi:hypothetical protein
MKRFQEISPGLLRGGIPSENEISALKNIWGVKRIISLDLEAGEKIDNICNKLNIEHLIIPLLDIDRDSLDKTIKFLSKNIVELMEANKPTYIHCVHGRDRTGLAVALYRIKGQGWSEDQALSEARKLDFGKGLSSNDLNLFLLCIHNATQESSDIAGRKRKIRKTYFTDVNDNMAYVGLNNNVNTNIYGLSPNGVGYLGDVPYGNFYL